MGITQIAKAPQALNPCNLYSEKRVSFPELLWYCALLREKRSIIIKANTNNINRAANLAAEV